jgi:DNA-directed RNA polymerase specialized sigma24 family protein
MTDSRQLLREYAQNGSETAFRELVARYLDLVYSVALRRVDGDAHRAHDVAQTVFIDLARMARSLPEDVMPGGWLHRHTCYVAANVMREGILSNSRLYLSL